MQILAPSPHSGSVLGFAHIPPNWAVWELFQGSRWAQVTYFSSFKVIVFIVWYTVSWRLFSCMFCPVFCLCNGKFFCYTIFTVFFFNVILSFLPEKSYSSHYFFWATLGHSEWGLALKEAGGSTRVWGQGVCPTPKRLSELWMLRNDIMNSLCPWV